MKEWVSEIEELFVFGRGRERESEKGTGKRVRYKGIEREIVEKDKD